MKTFRILISEIYGKEIDIKAKTEEEAKKIYEEKGFSDDQVYRDKFIEAMFCTIEEVA
jgi:hypothetical protein